MSRSKKSTCLYPLGIALNPPRAVLFFVGVAVALSLYFGLPDQEVVAWLRYGSFYISLLIFGVVLFFGGRRFVADYRKVGFRQLRRSYFPALIGALIVFLHTDLDHKVAMDDYILSASAKVMYEDQQYIVPLSGSVTEAGYFVDEAYLDKRPWFYPFTVSLAHFLTGWRVENAFYVNVCFGLFFLGVVCAFGRKLAGVHGAWLAVLLAASLPLFAQSATGGGMDMANLSLLALLIFVGSDYLKQPDPQSEGALAAVLVCLVFTRYESILYVVPTLIVIALGWLRARRIFLSAPVLGMLPMLAISLLQNRYFRGSEALIELHAGASSQFGLAYLPENLSRATYFFFNLSDTLANSAILSLFGLVSIVLVSVYVLSRIASLWREYPGIFATGLFVAAILANFFILMAYHDGKLDRIFASRLALPIYLAFILATISALRLIRPCFVMQRFLILFTIVYIVGWTIPANSREIFSNRNYVHNDLDWLIHEIGPDVWERDLIVDERSVAWALEGKQVLRPIAFLEKIETMEQKLEEGFYENIYLIERLESRIVDGQIVLGGSRYPAGLMERDVLLRRSFRPFSIMQLSKVNAIHTEYLPANYFDTLRPLGQRQDYGYDGL